MNVTLPGNRIFVDDQVKMESLEWVLIRHDCVLIQQRGIWAQRQTPRKDNAKTQGERHLQAEECLRPSDVRREA